jgi:hypothetical protein
MTFCRHYYYLFGGTVNGLNDPNLKKIGPANDLWSLELPKKFFLWSKMPLKGDIPPPRSNHIAVAYKKNDAPDSSTMIFIHGGMNESGKLDDCYYLDAAEGKFSKITLNNVGPHPRANHTAIVVDDKIYMFGGNGGRFFENSVFKDLWVLDVEKLLWSELKNDCKKIFKFLNYFHLESLLIKL